jgi:hypothetical protein
MMIWFNLAELLNLLSFMVRKSIRSGNLNGPGDLEALGSCATGPNLLTQTHSDWQFKFQIEGKFIMIIVEYHDC